MKMFAAFFMPTRKTAVRKTGGRSAASAKPAKKWSAQVTRSSDALDLESGIFKVRDPLKIARSLKRSAEKSNRKKSTPRQSAMSMLNFYMNRAGTKLPARDRKILDQAKAELRRLVEKKKKSNTE